jgi:hypothetical protein
MSEMSGATPSPAQDSIVNYRRAADSRAKCQHNHILSSSRGAKPPLAQECCLTIV